MHRCDAELIPIPNRFHVRPLAVGAFAPIAVINRLFFGAAERFDPQ
jgi:hypothetical protein